MKKAIVAVLAILAFGVAVEAQMFRALKAEVPFEFIVGEKKLPAGEYRIWQPIPTVVQIQDVDANDSAFISTFGVTPKEAAKTSALVFNRYPNGSTFLNQVRYEGEDVAREAPKSRLERESVTSSLVGKAAQPEKIVVAAYRR